MVRVADSFVVRDRWLEMNKLSPPSWNCEKDLLRPSSTILSFRYNLYLLLYTNFLYPNRSQAHTFTPPLFFPQKSISWTTPYWSMANTPLMASRLLFTWIRNQLLTTDRTERQHHGREHVLHPQRIKSSGTIVDVLVVAPLIATRYMKRPIPCFP